MKVTVSPAVISGEIFAPASKSSMQRACAAALISGGECIIRNPGNSNDDRAALGVIRTLGAGIENLADGSLRVRSAGVKPVAAFVSCGESGLGIRMFAPLVALSPNLMTIEGEGSLLSRPMDFFDQIFSGTGYNRYFKPGKAPAAG